MISHEIITVPWIEFLDDATHDSRTVTNSASSLSGPDRNNVHVYGLVSHVLIICGSAGFSRAAVIWTRVKLSVMI